MYIGDFMKKWNIGILWNARRRKTSYYFKWKCFNFWRIYNITLITYLLQTQCLIGFWILLWFSQWNERFMAKRRTLFKLMKMMNLFSWQKQVELVFIKVKVLVYSPTIGYVNSGRKNVEGRVVAKIQFVIQIWRLKITIQLCCFKARHKCHSKR